MDAIPDIGENQQIVATEWPGRSPRDIEDQVTYPLSAALLGVPGVKTIRSTSMFGMSFIYIIFKDNVEFYWSRSRILEKLNSLPAGVLPAGVQPTLGPDATALGQVYWYTLEGRDVKSGKPAGGWDPQELRTIQDFYVKYALASAEGVSEIASIGGFVKEYQVDIDPEELKAYDVTVMDVMNAVRKSNLDIGAETVELNKVEYVVRGLGYIKNLSDLEDAVITARTRQSLSGSGMWLMFLYGPATRRGGLDKGGAEAAGAVVVARYGSNPMEVIENIKEKIQEISPGLPSKTLSDGTLSKVTIVPFYDRSGLIRETIGTLETALAHEILISIIVIMILVLNLRASFLISGLLPAGVLITFVVMRYTGVEANIVALSGIAIAIGVMVDVGIIFVENMVRHLEVPENGNITRDKLDGVLLTAMTEVSPAIITALATTVVSFLPVFAMQVAEGKLFRPLAFTKTFALLASFVLGIVVLPTIAHIVFSLRLDRRRIKITWNIVLMLSGLLLFILWHKWPALALPVIGLLNFYSGSGKGNAGFISKYTITAIALIVALYYLTAAWLPLGAHNSITVNFLFVAAIIAIILIILQMMIRNYEKVLRWCLENKWKFMMIPFLTLLIGVMIWVGFGRAFGFLAKAGDAIGWRIEHTRAWTAATDVFPGTGKEFMPPLDEGSFLLMPTSMPNAGVEQSLDYVKLLDKQLSAIPEIETSAGKWGRVNSALDPAPVQMFETTINYKSEYILNEDGRRMRFKTGRDGSFILKDGSHYNPAGDGFRVIDTARLMPDRHGDYFRQWRPEIKHPDDIWNEIVKVTNLPGLTSAPKLQPIQTRLIMLSTGMRAPMGLKVYGHDLQTIEKAGLQFENALKEVPSIRSQSVFYDRAVGAPYIEIRLDRNAMARYGMTVSDVQEVIQVAIGGMTLTSTVEGRERFPVRVRYPRELRSTPEDMKNILIPSMNGVQVPLGQVTTINYAKGPQMIRSENTFLTGYVVFDKKQGKAEVNVVEDAQKYLQSKIRSGTLQIPAGVTYKFAGNYEQEIRASKRLALVIPISLILIFLLLYFRFKTIIASSIHFSGVFVAFAGGFIMIWLYGQPWFANFDLAGINMRDLFQMHTINISVAVWVGFIALFGIATNDGVIMGNLYPPGL